MWSVWGAFVVLFAAISLYASRLARDEEDQIFLGESFDHEKSAQAEIIEKVNKVQPFKKVALGLVAAMTVVILVYYIIDIVNQFK